MNVLIGCERSGRIRDAYIRYGHNAFSCDLEPTEVAGPHIQDDILKVISESPDFWDLFIAHPECKYLANSGVLRLYIGGKKVNGIDSIRWEKMIKAAQFFKTLLNCDIPKIAIENPVIHGHAMAIIGTKWTQTIQPYQFGHPESKRTCLWLKNLPKLKPTNVLDIPECGYWENQTPSGQNKLGPSPDRSMNRARTYDGIAEAMPSQWGTSEKSQYQLHLI